MCRGHPRTHPCSHMSVKWLYCPKARFDLHTGQGTTPCRSAEYYPAQAIKSDCSLQNCAFKTLGGAWMCCLCHQGPNDLGWCTAPKIPVRPAAWGDTTMMQQTTTETNMDHHQQQYGQLEYQEHSPPMDEEEGSSSSYYYHDAAESSASGSAVAAGGVDGVAWGWMKAFSETCGHGCCEGCTPVHDMLDSRDVDSTTTSTSGRHRKKGLKDRSGSKR